MTKLAASEPLSSALRQKGKKTKKKHIAVFKCIAVRKSSMEQQQQQMTTGAAAVIFSFLTLLLLPARLFVNWSALTRNSFTMSL